MGNLGLRWQEICHPPPPSWVMGLPKVSKPLHSLRLIVFFFLHLGIRRKDSASIKLHCKENVWTRGRQGTSDAVSRLGW